MLPIPDFYLLEKKQHLGCNAADILAPQSKLCEGNKKKNWYDSMTTGPEPPCREILPIKFRYKACEK
jgi:hypothetical protein